MPQDQKGISQSVNPSGTTGLPRHNDVLDRNPSDMGPNSSAGPAMRETADPNFSAAHRDRSDATDDAGTARMDTSRKLDPDAPNAPRAHGRSGQSSNVGDVMTADVAVCNPQTQLYYVARMMDERDCGAVPVVQSTDSMNPIGIITDRDIVVRGVAKNEDVLALRAGDVMSVDLVTVHPDMSLDDCARLMEDRQVRRAIVVDHTGRCCGIIAQADIVRHANKEISAQLLRDVSEPNPEQSNQHYH